MSLKGSENLATCSSELSPNFLVADPDIAGIGVVLAFTVTAILSLILLVISFLSGYRGSSVSRLFGRQASFRQVGISLMDHIAVTSTSMAIAFVVSGPSLSAFSRNLIQLCVSISSTSAGILLISTIPTGPRQAITVAITSFAFFTILLCNAFANKSLSAEVAWLESGDFGRPIPMEKVYNDMHPLGVLTHIIPECLFTVSFGYYIFSRLKGGRNWIGELGCLTIGILHILVNFVAIIDLHKKYEPYLDDGETWTFGQVVPLLLLFSPFLSLYEAFMNAPQDEQHAESEVGNDMQAREYDLPWYFPIFPAIFFVRKFQVVVILVGGVGVCFAIMLLLQWHHGNHVSVRQTTPLVRRITYLRNFLHYALRSDAASINYAATSLGVIPSHIWFIGASKAPPGYRQVNWKCSCGKYLAANFDNSNPDALKALERRLHSLDNPGDAGQSQQSPAVPATSSSSSGSTGAGKDSAGQSSTSTGKDSSANITGLSRRNVPFSNISQRAGIPRYFELCVSTGQHSVRLGEINISSVATDGQLFSKIWESYHGMQESSFGAALRGWFFKPDDVFFVHFGVINRHQVGIYGKPMEIPPQEEIDEGRYHYFECPMQPLPPMPDHIFLHYLDRAKQTARSENNPQVHAENIFLNRLPKKLGSSIFTTERGVDSTILYGWGVHIIERPSALAQSMVGIASAIICTIIFGIAWASAGLDKAIGIGQFVTGVLALVNAAIYFALQAYSATLSKQTT